MDENNKPQSDFDLDAALAEKFQQVQQDLDRLRAMNANADAQQAAKCRCAVGGVYRGNGNSGRAFAGDRTSGRTACCGFCTDGRCAAV
ncbi:MAG: hypothetical protein ACLTXT_04705 [Ruminococcus callidus]